MWILMPATHHDSYPQLVAVRYLWAIQQRTTNHLDLGSTLWLATRAGTMMGMEPQNGRFLSGYFHANCIQTIWCEQFEKGYHESNLPKGISIDNDI